MLLHAPEIRIVVRRNHAAYVKFRHFQTVFRQPRVDFFAQRVAQLHQPLVNFQHADAVFANRARQIALHLRHHHRAEIALAVAAHQLLLRKRLSRADHLQQEFPPVDHAHREFAARAQLHMQPARRVKQPHLAVRAPFYRHLHREIDEIHLRMECPFRVGRQLVQLFQHRQLLRFQRVSPRAERVQRLPVAEENRLLTLVHDQLRPEIEILNRVLPYDRVLRALVFNDARKPVLANLLGLNPLAQVVFAIAHGANERARALRRAQPHAALAARKFNHLILLSAGVDALAANGAFRVRAFGLVEHHVVSAMRANAAGELIRAHVDHIAARAIDLFSGKEAGFRLGKPPALRAFNHEFRHM